MFVKPLPFTNQLPLPLVGMMSYATNGAHCFHATIMPSSPKILPAVRALSMRALIVSRAAALEPGLPCGVASRIMLNA